MIKYILILSVATLLFSSNLLATESNYKIIKSENFSMNAKQQVSCFWQTFDGVLFIDEVTLNCTADGSYCDSIEFAGLKMTPRLDTKSEGGYLRVNISDAENSQNVFSKSKIGDGSSINAMVSYVKGSFTNGYQAECNYKKPASDQSANIKFQPGGVEDEVKLQPGGAEDEVKFQ